MTKLIKISGRTLGIAVEWILLLSILIAFVIRSPRVQTYLAQELASYLSKELNTTVSVDKVAIVFINRVALDGLYLEDQNGDTLIYSDRLIATINSIDIARNSYKLGQVSLYSPDIRINKSTENLANFQFLKDYFASERKKKKKSFFISAESIKLHDGYFQYDDFRHAKREKGMDYWHLRVSDINTKITDVEIVDRNITAYIANLSARESCGFHLSDMQSKAKITSKGVRLKSLELRTPETSIHASKFNLKSPSYYAFYSFVDSVAFDVKIDSSEVAMKDVLYFAPQLDGMCGKMKISTEIINKVPNLFLRNASVSFGAKSVINGNFKLDDYRELEKGYFNERVTYAYIDIEDLYDFCLPHSSGQNQIKRSKYLDRIGFFETRNLHVRGGVQYFNVLATSVSTNLGEIIFRAPIEFKKQPEKDYIFTAFNGAKTALDFNEVNLGHFLERKDLGIVNGQVNLIGRIGSGESIKLNSISGNIQRFDFRDIKYEGIEIKEGRYENNRFEGKIDIRDDYLDLTYDGVMDFMGEQHMQFSLDLGQALLDKLNLSKDPAKLSSQFSVNIVGTSPNKMAGSIVMDGLFYHVDGNEIYIPEIRVDVERSPALDRFTIKSEIADITIEGKLDLENFSTTVKKQLAHIFPALIELTNEERNIVNTDRFTYKIDFKNPKPLFDVIKPDLQLASHSTVTGTYTGSEEVLVVELSADSIRYKDFLLSDARIYNRIDTVQLDFELRGSHLFLGDTLKLDQFDFQSKGEHNQLFSTIGWNYAGENFSDLSWSSEIYDWNHLEFCIDPSYFYLNDHKWSILNESNIKIQADTIEVNYFALSRGIQLLKLNGVFSNDPKHHLNFNATSFDLSEITGIFLKDYKLGGSLDGWGFISTPFTDFNFEGDAVIHDLFVNNQEVGDIYLQSFWIDGDHSVFSTGDLIYRGERTFEFSGRYYLDREEEMLDYDLTFKNTSIEVANAFLDPEVISEIRGLLNGKIKLHGSPEEPKVEGEVLLQGASAYVGFLGAHFNVEGAIEVDNDGFYANSIPVFDEDGNAGSLVGSVYHSNFKDFSFDLQFDLENDAFNRDPIYTWKPLPLERFIIMDAAYEPGVLYYGKGVATGTVNIFGYTNNLEITVDLTTRKGTHLKVPMYGMGDIDEENNFIVFKDALADSLENELERKFNLSGVSLDLNFHATPDATVEIIFDENIGDIISARGYGDINIGVNNMSEVTMDGTYTVEEGVYDFAMGVIKKQFFIEKGGSISWTGDPYNALLNLKTYYKVNANISAISDDQIGSGSGGVHQPVQCYLNLNESLLRPSIEFDIKAPEANELAKSLIKRVTSDKDELNRQFFSLLLFRKFQPLNKSNYSGNVGAELITNQINSILSSVTDEYNLGVNYDNDNYSGDKQYEFVVSRTFLNDRLIITGSFGVENMSNGQEAHTDFIGDLAVEYLINESGTFRGKIFNESNDRTIILQSDAGRFTQGLGLNYKEEFNSGEDLKMIQYFFDLFRKRANKKFPVKKKKQQRLVPDFQPVALKEE